MKRALARFIVGLEHLLIVVTTAGTTAVIVLALIPLSPFFLLEWIGDRVATLVKWAHVEVGE